ncbi:hypothetical protein EDD18DRAFT_1279956 [Armillaria luteobubalina]|uniref:Uncharacterized protein n=1 Tax=Armillaria luteobubalina TaxID=153913 RepID=A0AA39QDB8_9AGAR|nr:hypothetical protein EDD18DRAFT_1279956 [Armillaria luteobubalina]
MLLSSPSASSPVLCTPSQRLKSSPLVSQSTSPLSPTFSSPLSAAQARRKSQYKAMMPSPSTPKRFPRHTVSASVPLFESDASTPEQSQKEFLRQRFQTRCFQRAAKARECAVKRKRHAHSDDVFDDAMNDDKEETEDEILKDVFFQRIVEHANRQTQHAYKLSYADEVGSSLDPDMEDLGAWEAELHDTISLYDLNLFAELESQSSPTWEELTPEEREIAELQAYADECERQAALANFEDIPEAFWNDSDLDEGDADAMDLS